MSDYPDNDGTEDVVVSRGLVKTMRPQGYSKDLAGIRKKRCAKCGATDGVMLRVWGEYECQMQRECAARKTARGGR